MKKTTICLLALLSLQHSISSAVDLSACPGQTGGEWNYGRVPNACNASPFGDDRVVFSTYPALIFMDQQSRTPERSRYTEEMHSLISEAARYYIVKRKPNVSAEEINQWVLAVVLTAAQESRMSHYRVAVDNHLKMLRGDSLHGHGMMQLDDRSHYNAIQSGIAWNLITNVTYGMDILFSEWERAPSQSCVGSATNYVSRIRSAWAAYNGGSGSICRWANPNSTWAANDIGFYSLYQTRTWTTYVHDEHKPASVNVPCLIENKSNCPVANNPPPVPQPTPGPAPAPSPQPAPVGQSPQPKQILKTSTGKYCILKDGKFACVDQYRDSICLTALDGGLNLIPLSIDDSAFSKLMHVDEDRHILCAQYDPTLLAVGTHANMTRALNLRATPGGGRLATVTSGEIVEILDFEVRNFPTNDRYYKIHSLEGDGYVYGGTKQNYADWLTAAVQSTQPPTPNPATTAAPALVQKGDNIRITNVAGINLRSDYDNGVLINIANGTKIFVEDVIVTGSSNFMFYRVAYAGHHGHIYGGELLPQNSTASWAIRLSN